MTAGRDRHDDRKGGGEWAAMDNRFVPAVKILLPAALVRPTLEQQQALRVRGEIMFGHRASMEPQRQWPCGAIALAYAGMMGNLGSSGKCLGKGRRCP